MNTISVRRTLSRAIGAGAFFALIAAGSAQAATITVTSFLDNGVNCTLRKAILNANAGGVVPLGSGTACTAGTAGSNTIVLGTGTYLFDLAPANGLPSGELSQFDLVNNNITIQGNGPANTIIDGQEKDFIFDNFNGTTNISITLTGLTVTRGKKGPSGFDFGGMYADNASVTLDNVVFTNNTTTASGAAVFIESGTLTINNSTFSGNTSSGEGGAIRSTGPMIITNSTFTGNSSVRGGALYFAGNAPGGTETAAITNSTFSGNTATLMGGAISLSGTTGGLGAMTLTHVTIANNTVTGGGGTGGGIYKDQSGAFNIDRTIIANNTAAIGPDCNAAGAQSFTSLNYNVIGSTTSCTLSGTTTNNFVGAVTLNALAGNGGPTQTISLPAYSPARDRAPTCATPTDQRGAARPLGIQCDSGAFEASPTVPQAPTIGTATGGNAQASITFTAPANDGGTTITGYTVTSNPGGITGTGASSPIVVSGLANGTAYTFTVTATNSVGTSAASAASNSVTPSGPPGAPTIGTATAGNAQASVTFTPPASNGGSAITSYTATSSPGGFTASGAASPLVVTSLTNGTAYTFTVRAANVNGEGPASAASNSVTPATVPGAPTIGTATAGDAQASVTFTAPASNGGSAITSYTVTSSPGGLTGTGATSPIVVSSLTNGTAYTFTVTATNAVGTGAPSAASNSVTPIGPPGAPTIGTATAGDAQASITFTAPASNGGSAITSYTVTSSPGGLTGTGATSPIVVSSLTNGTAYTFTVTATNAAGTGAASAASNSVTPIGPPGAPTIGTATAGDAQASITFTAPASNGGSAITSYTATSSPGGLTGTGATSPIVVSSLTNGTAYTFTVTATNAAGTGAASAASNSVTPIAAVTFADVALSKTVDNPTPGLGSNVTFTIVATNLGPQVASGVQVTDLLPAGLTYVSDTPSAGTYSSATGVWNIGTIANAGSATLSLVATVSRPQALVNQATKTAQAGVDPNASNNAALVGLNGPPLADIQVQQTVDNATPGVGATVIFTLSAKNAGPSSATGVELTDLLPASLTFVTASASQGSYVAATGLWTVGAVANGATATLQVTATNTSAAPVSSVAVKTAEVESDYATGNDAASVTLNDTTPADLSLSNTASQEPVAAGVTFAYTIVVANYGPASATGVTVTDTLPAGVALVSTTPSQGSCVGTTSVSCSLGTMSVGGTAEIALVVTKTIGGPLSNVATVTANEADPNSANNSHGEVTTPVEFLGFQIE